MYQNGFGNHFSTEAISGTLPQGQNSPQKVKHGLYAEQLNGTAFTAFRSENLRTWLYRIKPSVVIASEFVKQENGLLRGFPFEEKLASPNPLRWSPLPNPSAKTDFVSGMITMAGVGQSSRGGAVHHYFISSSPSNKFFYNSDAEMVYIPVQGRLNLRTEMGLLEVDAGEIAVIPRGVRFQIVSEKASGYVAENFGQPFRLPYLGMIGANGLANPRDFLYPVASYEEKDGDFELWTKFQGNLWKAKLDHSPLDVVAWHGNYSPYKYDLRLFQAYGPVTFDHPDPSIFTVLTSPSETPGTANLDFVIFSPRWLVMEHTFRPPYFHRNIMSEYMGLIRGIYEAKQKGFVPGGASLHNSFSPHGPDAATFEKASEAELKPEYLGEALAFMLESSLPFRPTAFAMETPSLQKDYLDCWKQLPKHFQKK